MTLICNTYLLTFFSRMDYTLGMPVSFIPGISLEGDVSIFNNWKLMIIGFDETSLYKKIMDQNYCTCVHDYDQDLCKCIDYFTSMYVRREAHIVVSYWKDDWQFPNPTSVRLNVGSFRTEFDVSIFMHDTSPFCYCDNFAQYITLTWEQIVGEKGSESETSFNEVLQDLFNSADI